MNERITDLLDRASDDGGRPVGFSGDQIVLRARRERRRRYGAAAAGLTAAAVAGVLVVTQALGSSSTRTQAPAVGPSTSAPASPSSPSAAPSLSPAQQQVVDQCAQQHLPAPVVRVPSGQGGIHKPETGDKIQDTSAGGPRASILRSWTLDAYVQDDLGLTATFVNPAHTRWASCDIASGGTQDAAGVFTAPLPGGAVPRSWFGPDGFRHQGNTVSWSQVCAPGEGKVCAHEVFAGALVRYDGVASIVVDAPDGTVLHPVLGDYTYVFRHSEARVDPHRAQGDYQTMPSMPVTLLDGQGHRIIRYDYFPPLVIPGSCSASGGC